MDRLLTVPNWSFGRNEALRRRFGEILARADLTVHYLEGDLDHNRTVSAFSGPPSTVRMALQELIEAAFEVIDLARHAGVHPRIGALDVLPFVPLRPEDLDQAKAFAEEIAAWIGDRHGVPVFLYERSERGRHEADLPTLRKGGFGALLDRPLNPDFGPPQAHPHLGVTVCGVRDFLLAVNVNLAEPESGVARRIAREIRHRREAGDVRFLGVRALGLALPTEGISQVSMNFTLPDLTPVDPVVEWIRSTALGLGSRVRGTELIGVIRPRDLEGATWLAPEPEQIVPL